MSHRNSAIATHFDHALRHSHAYRLIRIRAHLKGRTQVDSSRSCRGHYKWTQGVMHHAQEGLTLEIDLSGRPAEALRDAKGAGCAKDHSRSVRELERPLLTGTGIVPPSSFTLAPGDEIRITIDPIGTLTNVVE